MREITVDPSVSNQLSELTGQTVVCDKQGRALGFFSPLRDRPMLKDLQLEPPSSIEEVNERRKNRTGKPLEEILKRLGVE